MTPVALAVVLAGVFAGGLTGGAIGFGVVLVGAPVVALGAPQLLPAVFVAPSLAANVLVAWSERHHADRRLLGRLLLWQLPGMAVGLWALRRIGGDDDVLALVVAVIVLVLVLAGASPWRPGRTRGTEAVAASIAGLSGAFSGINGPPLAVLMSHDPPGLLRATLPAYFVVAQLLLLAGWGLVGEVTDDAVLAGVAAVPAAVAGAFVGQRWVASRLSTRAVRVAVLALAVAAAARAVVAA